MQADNKTVSVGLTKKDQGLINNQADAVTFKYDNILQNTSQDGVFTQCATEVVDNVLNGYNGTIFAYGQTGAGKTYTMSGDASNYSQRGIAPRAVHHIFREMDLRVEKEMVVRCSYLEIYNETMYDLLADDVVGAGADNLVVVERDGMTKVKGLTKKYCASEAEALSFFFAGEANRATAAHILNKSSSRSHCIFTLYLESRASGDGAEKTIVSKLNLVDLAGSERTKKTAVTGQALKEATYINKSLTFLEQTVNALSRHEAHVPFRQSKLTGVLRDALGGNCRTVMIACVWPDDAHAEETVSTCRFASRVRTLTTDAVVNESKDPHVLVRKYERQIAELKQELAMRDTFAGRAGVNYGDIGEVERQELNEKVRNYLTGEAGVDSVPVETLKQVKEAFRQFKAVYAATRTELEAELKKRKDVETGGAGSNEAGAPEGGDATNQSTDAAAPEEGEAGAAEVGESEDTAGFHLGVAPSDAAPPAVERPTSAGAAGVVKSVVPPSPSRRENPDAKNAAFLSYKRTVAPEKAAKLADDMAELRDKRQALKEKCAAVNQSKADIDRLQKQVEGMQVSKAAANPGAQEDIVDSDTYQAMAQLKAAKTAYRRAYDDVKDLRAEMEPVAAAVQEGRAALVAEFQAWYAGGDSGGEDGGGEDGDDYGERFENMELQRIMESDPESSAFFAARKTLRKTAKKVPAGRAR